MKNILYSLSIFFVISACTSYADMGKMQKVRNYISASWDRTVRTNTVDDSTLIGMPYPYTVPSPEGMFQEMYYWDTYFTNKGLIRDGRLDLAKGNVDDMLYLVRRFGYMPNGSRTWYLNRSQPPFLTLMVSDIFDAVQDTLWLSDAYRTLETEYAFWQTRRSFDGLPLNHYYCEPDEQLLQEAFETCRKRISDNVDPAGMTKEERDLYALHFLSEAESGWDCNPRFKKECSNYAPLDLNSLLFAMEKKMSEFSRVLGYDCTVWENAAEKRKECLLELCLNPEDGMFYDYNVKTGQLSDVRSAAMFCLMFTGMVDSDGAADIVKVLESLEDRWGLNVCENKDYKLKYQWSYPNAWPPTTLMAVYGLDRYGYRKEALRLAHKYTTALTEIFARTGKLWEKYNAGTGGMDVAAEYETPEMMGWTAGVFNCLMDYIYENE